MMRLFIVRHGIAELRNISSGLDEDRELTPEGKEKMQRGAAGLKKAGYVPEAILSSSLVRARQTAEILMDTFGPGIPLKITQNLAPWGDRGSLYREILKYSKTVRSLMLVGHQPSLGEIAGDLAFGSPDHYFNLKKGSVCVIDLEVYRGELRGMLVAMFPPAFLRKLISKE